MKNLLLCFVVMTLLASCLEAHRKVAKIDSETDLVITAEVSFGASNVLIKGKTNLPDSTKLGVSAIRSGAVVAQDFDVFVKDGEFEVDFGVDFGAIELIEVACHQSSIWQSDNIIRQLKFIKTPLWSGDKFSFEINVRKILEEKVKAMIEVDDNYKTSGRPEGAIAHSMSDGVLRCSLNATFSDKLPDVDMEKEIRFLIFDTWQKNRSARAIVVKCFEKNESIAFKTGCFAPYGDWNKASEKVSIDKFQVKI